MYYIQCDPYCVYDYPSSISDLKPVKTDISSTLYVITSTLADNIPLFLCHGINSVYDIICIIYHVPHTVCMTNPALYLTGNTLKLTSLPLHM